jgi:hypothetical protein
VRSVSYLAARRGTRQGLATDDQGGPMRRDESPDFIGAIARGLDVICIFRPHSPVMSQSQIATAAELARPTARRILITLE